MLSPYRVLDLTDDKGLLCGKLLADLGADVIKIEKPGGDSARSLGPFYHDRADPEKSLFWFAFNTGKRGITLDVETADGKEIFKRLVADADFVIESFPPGYMDSLGLGYTALEKVNPRIIMVSITPFGQTGPYRDYKATDIVAWAMGARMYPVGDEDRPPVRISHHSQTYLHAGAEGAVGALLALQYREMTGEGQQVDVSIQESVAQLLFATARWDALKAIALRREPPMAPGLMRTWPCKDGHVAWMWFGGTLANFRNAPFVKWMDSEGMATDFLKEYDWEKFDTETAPPEIVEQVAGPTAKFFMAHTKAEILDGAAKRGALLGIVGTTSDLLENPQLVARGFWAEIEHPELGTTIKYPGAFTHSTEVPPGISRPAPLIGEHNVEIYEKELGLSREELLILKQAGII
ncbi:CaiB/BaiF CoA transferase family protein [Chloroflexota bacterium]